MRNPATSRRFPLRPLTICTPTGEREPHLVAHPTLRRVAVEPLHERAAVRVPELVRDHVRRQAALHQERGVRVPQLVELVWLLVGMLSR